MRFRNAIALVFALILLFGAGLARAASTVNPTVPAQNSSLNSAVVRNNFLATYNDISNILGMYAGPTAPANPTPLQIWANTTTTPNYVLSIWNPTTSAWITYATLNINTGVYTPVTSSGSIVGTAPVDVVVSGGVATVSLSYDSNFANSGGALTLAPIASGHLIANCTSGSAEPSNCTWNNYAAQAIGSTNGLIPSYVSGAWSTVTTGANGHAIPFLDGANTFSAIQTIYAGSSGLQTPLTGTLLKSVSLDSVITRTENDAYGAASHFSGARADGTAAVPSALVTGDEIASFNAFGYDGTSGWKGPYAGFRCYASQGWTSTLHGTYCDVTTTAGTASAALAENARFENDGGITVPSTVTGGDKGAGTINAGGVYVNGVAVTAAGITALTGDATATGPGSATLTLATVNSNVGTFGSSTQASQVTVNAKGLVTAASGVTITPAVGSITGLGTNVATALGGTLNASGGLVGYNGSIGAASGTSLALGGATIGSNTLAVTGTFAFSAGGSFGGALTGITTLSASGQITSTVTTGTAPFVVASTTNVVNLNASSLNGATFAAPGAIGGGTAAAGTFTTVSATTYNGGALSGTFTGNPTLSGNVTHSGQLIETGTSAAAQAAGQTQVLGLLSAPSLTTTGGQAILYTTAANGAVVQGFGSTYDAVLADKAGSVAVGVSTGTVNVVFGGTITAPSLATPSSNIAGALCATSGGGFLYNSGGNCYAGGTASSIDAGGATTQVANGTANDILYITGTSPLYVNKIATANGGVVNTSSSGVPTVTATPVLGVAGTTVGTLGFQNATSGTVILSPPTGALGTATLTLPATTDTLVALAATQSISNKTFTGTFTATGTAINIGANSQGTTINLNGGSTGAGAGINIQTNGSTQLSIGSENFIIGSGSVSKVTLYSSSSTYRLYGLGAGTVTTDASGNIVITSDETLKTIRGDFARGLAAISDISPIVYSWNNESGYETSGTYVGFSAQNVQQSIPEAIGHRSDGKLTLQDRPIIAALVNAVKELKRQIETLENR